MALTNGDVDHVAGLLTLREKTAFDLFATPATHTVPDANPILGVFDPALVRRRLIAAGVAFTPLPRPDLTTDAVPGKILLHP